MEQRSCFYLQQDMITYNIGTQGTDRRCTLSLQPSQVTTESKLPDQNKSLSVGSLNSPEVESGMVKFPTMGKSTVSLTWSS